MEQREIKVELRSKTGKNISRQIRAKGLVPGIVYGKGMTAVPVTINPKELTVATAGDGGENALITLIAEGELNGATVIVALLGKVDDPTDRTPCGSDDRLPRGVDQSGAGDHALERRGEVVAHEVELCAHRVRLALRLLSVRRMDGRRRGVRAVHFLLAHRRGDFEHRIGGPVFRGTRGVLRDRDGEQLVVLHPPRMRVPQLT